MRNRANLETWICIAALAGASVGCLSLEPLSSYSDGPSGAPAPMPGAEPSPRALDNDEPAPSEEPIDVSEGLPADGELALEPAGEPQVTTLEPAPAAACVGRDEFLSDDGATCYRRSLDNVAWTEALAHCEAWGGGLVVIDSREEDAFLAQHIDASFWIGASDRAEEGRVLWNGGAAMAFSNWAQGEPNDYAGREDCVVKTMPLGSWNDLSCRTPNAFVCERR